jgi:2-oxoglutarate/2-oxoacid ferredoxin oxidoreductase subunit alpha
MVRTRQAKVDAIAATIAPLAVDDPTGDADVLVLGWGSTYGPMTAAVRAVRARGGVVAQTHLRHLNPFPSNLGTVLRRYSRVIVPEMNLGQLSMLLRAKYLVDVQPFTQVRGLPFTTHELVDAIAAATSAIDAVHGTDETPDEPDHRPADETPVGAAAPEEQATEEVLR